MRKRSEISFTHPHGGGAPFTVQDLMDKLGHLLLAGVPESAIVRTSNSDGYFVIKWEEEM